MTNFRWIEITVLCAAFGLSAKAAPGREVITTGQIAAAIGDAGLPVSASQVTLLTDVVARTYAPALKVQSVGPWEGNCSRVRLACVVSEECLPFVVTVRRHQNDHAEGAATPSKPKTAQHSAAEVSQSRVLLHIGSPAVLLLEGGHIHIRLAVICLENGSVGETIRVAGREQHRTYLAEVCSDGLLRGTL